MKKEQHTAKFLNGKEWITKWIVIQWNMYKNNTLVLIQEWGVARLKWF